ncbi:MAG: hypothetical protein J0M11_18645 [Anaerolineae bacterium]|nr:hypothetical protein [Anaerolineae bacterium]
MNKKFKDRNNQKPKQHPKDVTEIELVLDNFKIIQSKPLRFLFNSALILTTVIVVFFIFNSWYTKAPVEALYVSGGIVLILYLLLANELFEKFPQTIKILWRRNLLCQFDENSLKTGMPSQEESVLKFLQDTRIYVDSKNGIFCGFAGLFISAWLVWLLDQNWILNAPSYIVSMPAPLIITLFLRTAFIFSCFICGIVAWHIFSVGKTISALGRIFRLDIKINHPDGCGGLSPIGDLCLKLVYCVAPFLILIGAWLIFVNILDISYLHMQSTNLNSLISTLQILLLPFTMLSFLIFFFPIISIRNSMLHAKSLLDIQLDAISQKIHSIEMDLLTQADSLPTDRRIILEEDIDFLKRSYGRFQPIPTWPFRFSHLFRLTTSQIIPFIGVTTSLMSFIKDITK